MVLGLTGSAWMLRLGLDMRRRRLRGERRDPAVYKLHVRLAPWVVGLLMLGFVGGPVSSYLLRGWEPFGRFHAWIGVPAALLFAATGFLGYQLKTGKSRAVEAHARLALAAVLAGALAAVAGFVLLP